LVILLVIAQQMLINQISLVHKLVQATNASNQISLVRVLVIKQQMLIQISWVGAGQKRYKC
jgi:hypothetical protein